MQYDRNQIARLGFEASGCTGHLLDQCGVLLGYLVHLIYRLTYLNHARRLLTTHCWQR